MKNIDLKEIAGGSLQEKFSHSLDRIMENLQDVNTPYKDKREIVIKMTFVQNEARDDVQTDIKVTEKLASQGALATHFSVAKDLRTGKVIAEEYGNQLKGQLTIEDGDEEMKVDVETGEVVDFRKVK